MPDLKVRIEAGKETSGDGVELQEKQDKGEKGKTALVSLVAHQAVANAQKILNYSVANIGNFTGDYTKGEGIQFALGIASDLATIGVGIATNPVAGVISIAGVAVSKTLEAISYFQDLRHQEIENDFLKQRSGNSLLNGSRGTEN